MIQNVFTSGPDTARQGEAASGNRWFAARRPLFVKNMVKEFAETFDRFRTIYEQYLTSGTLSFAEFARLVGTDSARGRLWVLKDHCHQLWRETDADREPDGCLLDWLLGSIFHEAMKLKENIYLLQHYGPLAEALRKQQAATPAEHRGGIEGRRFLERISGELEGQMESLAFLFGQANFLLRAMMAAQADNPLLLRFLLENPDLPQSLWAESLESLLTDMYPQGPEYGFCLAARSYEEGNWYAEALAAYDRALAINRDCAEALHNSCRMRALAREQEKLAGAGNNTGKK